MSMATRQRLCAVFVALGLAGSAAADSKAGAQAETRAASPEQLITQLHERILASAKLADRKSYQARVEMLEPVVRHTHDLDYIAEVTLGGYWEKLERDQRERFVERFTRLSVATYASRFRSYSGETFRVTSTELVSENRARVSCEVVTADEEKVVFEYLLHNRQNQWRIINIIVDGVSDLALKRAEYNRYMRQGGFDELMAELEKQLADKVGRQ